MPKRTHDKETLRILTFLKDDRNFDALQRQVPVLDLDIAIDLLRDPSHELHAETKAFLSKKLDPQNAAPSKSRPKQAFQVAQSPTKQSLTLRGASLALKIADIGTRVGFQSAPNAVIAGAIAASMLGNSPETNAHTAPVCDDANISICDNNAIIKNLNTQDRTIIRSMLATTQNTMERKALNAIAVASSDTNVDVSVLIAFAQLESSLGKSLSASTSSAKGVFQYTKQTWLESFKKHQNALPQEHQYLADKIYKKDGEYRVTGSGIESKILDLRTRDHEIHATITALDMAKRDTTVLKSSWEAPNSDEFKNILDVAKSLNMGRAAEGLKSFWNALHNDAQNPDISIDQAFYDKKKSALINFTAKIYMDHFLGESGARRLLNAYENENIREKPIKNFIDTDKQAASQRAIAANFGVFKGGERSPVEVFENIRSRVEVAFNMIDKRVAKYENRQEMKTTITFDTSSPNTARYKAS